MSLPLDLFQIIPGNLGAGYCITSPQRFNVDIISRARVVQRNQVGSTFWNIQAETPDENHRLYPWLNTANNQVYTWSNTYGKWISWRPFEFGQIWAAPSGTPESAIWSLDGGDGTDPRPTLPDGSVNPSYNPPTPTAGAMWMMVQQLAAKFPVGVGAFTSGAMLPIAGTGGAETVALTEAQNGPHTHGPPANSDKFWAHASPASSGQYNVLGSGVDTILGVETDTSGDGEAHDNIPPYYVVFFVTRTTRQYYAING